MSGSSSHFVSQFSGSRGPTDPSGHVLTMGMPNGDAVGNDVGAADEDGTADEEGTPDGAGATVLAEGDKVGMVEGVSVGLEVGASILPIGDEDGKAVSFSQGKISGKHSGE